MPVYHYSSDEKQAQKMLGEHDLLRMVVDDPFLVLELKKIERSVNASSSVSTIYTDFDLKE